MKHGNLHALPDGRWVVDIRKRVDLGVITETEAERAQQAMTPPPALDDDGRLAWHEAELARIRAQRGESIPLAEVWPNYANAGSTDTKSSTTGAYARRWRSVEKWADQHGVVTLGQFNDRTIDALAADLGRKYKGTTLNSTMQAARQVVKASVGRHGRNPFDAYAPVKAVGRDHRPFTAAELRMILSRAQGEMLTACYMLTYTGQRASDTGAWEWSRVDFERGILWCRQRKTGARVELPMHRELAVHLWNVKGSQSPPRAHIMPEMAERQALAVNATAHAVNLYLRSLGFRSTEDGIVGSHSFRYSCVTILRAAGVPDGVIQEIVGHSTKAMLDHYSRVGIEARTAAIAQLPAFTGASEC